MRKIDVLLIFILLLEIGLVIGGSIFITKNVFNNDNVEQELSDNSDYVDYIEILSEFVNAVRTEVNKAERFQFFDVETLYLVPVKNGKCNLIKYDLEPVFGDEWEFVFVGVIYNGAKYDYYVIALDDAGYAVDFVAYNDLSKKSANDLVTSKDKLSIDLTKMYNLSENRRYVSEIIYDYYHKPPYLFDEYDGLKKLVEVTERKYIDVIAECTSRMDFY